MMGMLSGFRADTLDRVGAGLSLICALHCLISPLVIGVASVVGAGMLFSAAVEGVLGVSALFLAGVSFLFGIRRHRRWQLLALLGAALVPMLAGRLVYHGPVETAFVVLGSLFLVAGHLWNRRLCALCDRCKD